MRQATPQIEREIRNRIRKLVEPAISAEEQAIAIYQTEIRWLGPGPEGVFIRTLAEELSHLGALQRSLEEAGIPAPRAGLSSRLNRLSGWLVGTALALLPERLRHLAHVWAEEQAAEIYNRAFLGLTSEPRCPEDLRDRLLRELEHAFHQEKAHSLRFRDLNQRLTGRAK